MNHFYEQFLQRKPLGTQSKNFTHHKPDHLEEYGLVAAYNMKPSAGGVLADISGNGNNGTIN